ncbi:protein-L-isoaspartate(D-aspartate) O-methyltransferase [Methylocaldum szegediense]|uniref:Protein-L-isoaspartate O-methyltransferase n=1 Tax=Methylocaldum szegediense TaxID=73780 RepID=A0ABM9I5F5_9GAMM|nr:protein-L-isoaspartate(D-aspartate) O-methyltransferase [Methylocaldum szegediense]CAI8904354.1 Protein-L-isoaspartate O-methyltransferase 2 [Methylocaldum szegediense]
MLTMRFMHRIGYAVLLGIVLCGAVAEADEYAAKRRAMIDELRRETRWVSSEIGKSELDVRVLEAMAKVPRHEFVSQDLRSIAYANRPLPIGYGQTISQPFIVALMTDLLRVGPDDTVLEIGTGSGYQAAVLAELARQVYSIEIVPELTKIATERLKRLGYTKVETKTGDGYYGWPEHAPFDGIIVTAAPTQIPPPLVQQLKPGGRMIIPVGGQFLPQYLVLVEKSEQGRISTRQILPVQFVPLTGAH